MQFKKDLRTFFQIFDFCGEKITNVNQKKIVKLNQDRQKNDYFEILSKNTFKINKVMKAKNGVSEENLTEHENSIFSLE